MLAFSISVLLLLIAIFAWPYPGIFNIDLLDDEKFKNKDKDGEVK